jgi:hypothetical protein
MMPFIRLAFGAAILAMAAPSLAQVYKCVDASGKTVYSQVPCPANTKSSSVRTAPPAPRPSSPSAASDAKPAAASAGPKTAAELEQEFRKRRADQEEARKKEQEKIAESKDREDNCRAARAQLAGMDAGTRQVRIDEKGERVFLDDSQIAREKDRMRRVVQEMCR